MSPQEHLERKANAHVCDCEGCEPMCEDCAENYCEHCGGELSQRMVGDEHYTICSDCGAFDGS